MRRLRNVVGFLILAPLAFVALLLVLLQTDFGQEQIVSLTNTLVPGVEIEGLSGNPPGSLNLERLTLSDADGAWLKVEGVRFRWDMWALLRAAVIVPEASVERVAVLRLPPPGAPADEPPPEDAEPFAFPQAIPPVRIDRLAVDRLELAESIVGEAMVLAIDTSLNGDDGQTVTVDANVTRLDVEPLTINANITADLPQETVALDLDLVARSGLLPTLAGDPRLQGAAIELQGSGPLDAWSGRLDAVVDGIATLAVDLDLGLDQGAGRTTVGLNGRLAPVAEGLQPAFAELIGDGIDLVVDAEIAPERTAVTRLDIQGAWLAAEGTASLEGERIAANLSASVDDLGALEPVIGSPTAGELRLDLRADGTLQAPNATLIVDGSNLQIATLALETLRQELTASPDADGTGFRVALDGRLGGLAVDGPGGQFSDDVTLAARARVEGADALSLESFALDGRSVAVELQGSLEGDAIAASGSARLPDLAAFSPLAGQDLQGAVDLELSAQGSTTAPEARVELVATDVEAAPIAIARLDQIVEVTPAGDGLSVHADGTLDGLRIDAGTGSFEDRLSLTVRATRSGNGDLSLDTARIEGELVQLSATGALPSDGENLTASLTASVPDLAPIGAIAATDLEGSVEFSVEASGSLPIPEATVDLGITDLQAPGGLSVTDIQQVLRIEPAGDDTLDFDLDGRLDGLAVATGPEPFTDDVTIQARGTAGLDGAVDLQTLAVNAQSLTLAAQADFDGTAGAGDLNVTAAVPSLAAFAPLVGQALSGRIDLTADASFAENFRQIDADLALTGSDLQDLPAPADALLGPSPALTATVTTTAAGEIVARALRLDAPGVQVDANGSFDPATGDMSAELQATVPDLAPVGAGLGQELAGSVRLQASASGSVDEPSVTANLTADGLEAAGQSFETINLTADAAGAVTDLSGTVALMARKAAGDLGLNTNYRYTGDSVSLADLNLSAPGLALSGGVDAGLAGPTVAGSLTGGASDLNSFGAWLGQDLAGRLDLQIDATTNGGQNAQVRANGSGIAVPGVNIGSLTVDATARDLFGTLGLDADVDVRDVDAGTAVVESLSLTANGNLSGLDVALRTNGGFPQPFDVQAEAAIAMEGGETRVAVSRLDADVAELPVRLEQTLTVRLAGNVIAIDDLAMTIGDGRLAGGGSIGGPAADLQITLAELPLAHAEAFGAPPLGGTLNLDLAASGAATAPAVRVDARIDGFELSDQPDPQAVLGLQALIEIGGGNANLSLTTDGLGEPGLSVDGRVPVTLSFAPFAVSLPDPLPLEASIDGQIDLTRLGLIAGLDGINISGLLRPDIDVSGVATAPRLNGSVQMANGVVQDTVNGINLQNITLDLVAEGSALALNEFSAADGLGGDLRATGRIDVDPDAGLPLNIQLTMNQAALLQREDLSAVISGTTEIDGSMEALDVVGRLTVDRATARIPDPGAASFPSIEVVDVTEGPPEPNEDEAADLASNIALDIKIDMPGQIFVGGRGLESEWRGDLDITETAAAPRIVGSIDYVRGRFILLDRRFNITEGTVTLDGAFPPDPIVRFTAEAEIEDTTTRVTVNGPAQDPDIGFESDPTMPEDEILSFILFGRSTANINGFQALQLAAAVDNLAGNRTAEGFLGAIRGGLGLDTLEIGGESTDTATLRAGTYISEDVYVQVEQGLGEASGAIRVEVELTPSTDFVGRVRQDSTSSVGFQWSIDY